MSGLIHATDEQTAGLGASFRTALFGSLIPKDIPGSFCEFRIVCLILSAFASA